ncbi:MAG: hypothetical protein WC346_02930 [Methanogenium sp.]
MSKTRRRIKLDCYESVEKVVLIHTFSFEWNITPKTYKKDRREIILAMAKERAAGRTVVLRENGIQVFGRGII